MTHLWIRAESRPNEERTGITPAGITALRDKGIRVTVEDSPTRILPIDDFASAGATIVPEGSWPEAPRDAIIFGLKELPEADTPLVHRHIMFGHAYKGQSAGARLLKRFAAGGGALYDLEYLVDENGRRVAAFGYWAGYAGAAVSLLAWAAQADGKTCPPVHTWNDANMLQDDLRAALDIAPCGSAIVIGALGRVGSGARDLCAQMDVPVTCWDMAETAHGGPFPEILDHGVFLNCILATEGVPVFVPRDSVDSPRALRVIGDIACDPDSRFNPIPIYDAATSWAAPVTRVCEAPPLDVMAIDNLPSLLPRESSLDFAEQLLPHLLTLDAIDTGVWGRAHETYLKHKPEERT
ncbi:saccharopine dehydrogenase (NAD+, L-lysine forming) [Mameliella alba]|uniref:saccharopine dehydrogenase n=1 Tax=Mameliella alba TaxID=561184 RepID=UPI00087E3020|nr:saccharopine dehydrogenase [Mameliella alba]OWV47218.1 saccharopine dehydrogenase [Mameliella alba]PTR38762.1 saccharopine dehydrogenase (NAD+, L-lysine forming) [Mameliella alba]GGF69265.1 saccharopine dehydrogenase [Mameliella alba]SDD41632.1 saccharopine dehydrogenase (NAD+, L-lysine forming) [Mameliella alba]